MAGIITTGNAPKLLWPGVRSFWGQLYDQHNPEWDKLFDTFNSTMNYEEDVQIVDFGLAPIKSEASAVTYDSEVQGPVTRYTHVAYGLGFIVSQEELDDNQYTKVAADRTRSLHFSMVQTKEQVGASIYNNAFTTYQTADGVSLINSAHLNTSGGTFSNQLAVSANLSEGAIEDLTIQIMQATNDRGLLISLMPQSLHVAPQNFYQANRIIKSAFQTQTANNDVNVVAAVGVFPKGVHVNHYFTSPTAWFIRTNAPQGAKHFLRKPLELTQDNAFDEMTFKCKAYERYSFGVTDPRAVYGTAGT